MHGSFFGLNLLVAVSENFLFKKRYIFYYFNCIAEILFTPLLTDRADAIFLGTALIFRFFVDFLLSDSASGLELFFFLFDLITEL